MSYAVLTDAEARALKPRVVHVDENNRVVKLGDDAAEPVPGSNQKRGDLIAEAPKIRPHVEAMRANIAAALGLPAAAVNVKATTSERLGFVGREEGMAAYAVATARALPG